MTKLRSILLATCLTTPLLTAFPAITPAQANTPATKPNILLVIADDMGVDASRCYNVANQQANMPTIEKMCQQGMVFENAYAAPVCSPTRATIMTGKYGFRTGVGAAIPKTGGQGLSADEPSLFDALATTDYSTALIGKWHLGGGNSDLDKPAKLGVGYYYGLFGGGTRSYFHWRAVENGKFKRKDTYTTTDFTDRAINWIGAQQKPWFLWLAYNAPHTPFHLPPADLHTAKGLSDNPQDIRRNPVPYYNAALEAMDTEIGRLLKSMPEKDRRNTYVMFIGDNGTPGRIARPIYRQRGAKGSIFEGGTHVPLIITGPDVSHSRNMTQVNTTDLYATIAELAGAKTSAPDSVSIAPQLRGSKASTPRQHIYVEHFTNGGSPPKRADRFGWAVRDQRYKLVTPKGQASMLFDLKNDPLERVDLLRNATPEMQNKAKELLAAYQQLTR